MLHVHVPQFPGCFFLYTTNEIQIKILNKFPEIKQHVRVPHELQTVSTKIDLLN